MTPRISLEEAPKGIIDGFMKTEFYLRKSPLDHKLLELVKYRVSQLNGCAYCLDMHYKEAIRLGETPLRLYSLSAWEECPYYSDAERLALSYAEALTLTTNKGVEDDLFEKLLERFSREEVADLTLAIAQINAWNRLNKAFRPVPGNYEPGMY